MTTSLTAVFALPYPEGDEYVIGGDDAIQALAERLEVLLTPAYATAPGGFQSGIGSGGTPGSFTACSGSGQFTLEGGNTLRYTGPTRWFLIDVEAEATAAGGVTSGVEASLTVNAAAIATDKVLSQVGGGGTAAMQAYLRITTPGRLASGDGLQLIIKGLGGGNADFDKKSVRITSIGAPES